MEANEKKPNRYLRRERDLKGWSQRTLAELVGTTEQVVNRWENGQHTPNRYFQTQLCRLFGKNAAELGFMDGLQTATVEQGAQIDSGKESRAELSLSPSRATSTRMIEAEADDPNEQSVRTLNEGLGVQPLPTITAGPESIHKHLESIGDVGLGSTLGLNLQQTQVIIDAIQAKYGLPYDEIQKQLNGDIFLLDQMKLLQGHEASVDALNSALISITTLPLTLLRLLQKEHHSLVVIEDFLIQCAASITACQHLLRKNGLAPVEYVLSKYLPTLKSLSLQPSTYQEKAAYLTSQAYRLANILALHQNNLVAKEAYCRQAIQQSLIAKDEGLYIAALKGLAVTFYYSRRSEDTRQTYQQALRCCDSAPALLRSCVYAGLAEAQASCGEEQEALSSIALAHQSFPVYPERDVSFLYADFDRYQLFLWEGLAYFALGRHFFSSDEEQKSRGYYERAWEAFVHIDEGQGQIIASERDRTDILNRLATTALALGDRAQFLTYFEKGVQGVAALGSKRRTEELAKTYRKGRTTWPDDAEVKNLGDMLIRALLEKNIPHE